jgi:hypothetical protein
MQVLHRAIIVIHVQGVVSVMVVICILTMHHQVLQLASPLRYRP